MQVNTKLGAICSIMIITLTFLFGLVKLKHLADKKNPLISTTQDKLDEQESLNTASADLLMAFTIENRDGKTIDYDPAFVRWIAKTVEY